MVDSIIINEGTAYALKRLESLGVDIGPKDSKSWQLTVNFLYCIQETDPDERDLVKAINALNKLYTGDGEK